MNNNSPPPPYNSIDKKPNRRHTYNQSTQLTQNQNNLEQLSTSTNQTSLGRHNTITTQQSIIRNNNNNTKKKSEKRGLLGLISGLSVNSMLNINQQKPIATSSYHPNNQSDYNNNNNFSSHSGFTHLSGYSNHLSNLHNQVEDPLAILARYDTILLIDDSGSMSYQNRWKEAAVAVAGLADTLVKYDSDGIDVYFLNSVEYLRNVVSAKEVNKLFERVRPIGPCTPTDVRVEQLLNIYIDSLESGKLNNLPPIKPLNLIVITDGQADDPDALSYLLAGFTERLDRGRFPLNQLGVQFIQIGNDKNATQFLQSLDDDLRSNGDRRRDIIDTTPYQGKVTADFIIKSLLGGINKRIDHQVAY